MTNKKDKIFRWHASSGTMIPVDPKRARRLSRMGERVSPNPRCPTGKVYKHPTSSEGVAHEDDLEVAED